MKSLPLLKPSLGSLVQQREENQVAFLKARAHSIAAKDPFEQWVETLSEEDLEPIRRGDSRSAQDFLLKQASQTVGPIPEHLVSLVACLAHQWGWDVQRILTEEDTPYDSQRKAKNHQSFLEWLIAYDGGSYTTLPEGLTWPVNLEEFQRLNSQHKLPKNNEWLCALTIASGANPWVLNRGQRNSRALQNCLIMGQPAIAAQLLSLPGAPSLWESLNETLYFDADSTLCQYIMREHYGYDHDPRPDLSWVIEKITGLSLKIDLTSETPESLSVILVDQIENKKDQKNSSWATLKSLWTERLHKQKMTPLEYVENLALLPENLGWAEEAKMHELGKHTVDLFLNSPWGTKFPWRMDLDISGKGADWLKRIHQVDGNLSGSWSPINSRALRCLVSPSNGSRQDGLEEIQMKFMLSNGGNKNAKACHKSSNKDKAFLYSSLEETMNNGLSALGLWFLVLMGKAECGLWGYDEEKMKESHVNSKTLETESILFGITDWSEFCSKGFEPAVFATEWILEKSNGTTFEQSVRSNLIMAWAKAFDRAPYLMGERPDLLLRIFQQLSSEQVIFWNDGKEGHVWSSDFRGVPSDCWTMFMWQMWENPYREKRQSETLKNEALQTLELELILAMHADSLLNGLPTWALSNPIHSARILSWATTEAPLLIEKHGKNPKFLIKPEHIKKMLLEVNLPLPTPPPEKQRF